MVKTKGDKWLWVQWNSGDQSVINFSELVSLPEKAAVGQLVIAERNCKYEAASILAASRNRERLERKLAEAELRGKQILDQDAEKQMLLETKVQLELKQSEEAQPESELKQAGVELHTQAEPENSEAETEHLEVLEPLSNLKQKNEPDDNESDDEEVGDFSPSDSDWKPDEEKPSSDDEIEDAEIKERAMQRFYWNRRGGKIVKPRHRAEAINVFCAKNSNNPTSNTAHKHDTTKTHKPRERCCCRKSRKHIPLANQLSDDIMRNFRKIFCTVQKIKPSHWKMTRKEQICNAIKLAWIEAMWEKFVAEKQTKKANNFDDMYSNLTKENNTKETYENCEEDLNPSCTCTCKIHSESNHGRQHQEIHEKRSDDINLSKNQLLVTKKYTRVYKNNSLNAKHVDNCHDDSTITTMHKVIDNKEIENERNQSDHYDTEDELDRSDDDVLISNKYKLIHEKLREIHKDDSDDEKLMSANHEVISNEKENTHKENGSNKTKNADDHSILDDTASVNYKNDHVVSNKNKKVLAEHNQCLSDKSESKEKHIQKLDESGDKVLVNNKVYKNKNKRLLVEDNDDQADCKRKRIKYVEHLVAKNTKKIINTKNEDRYEQENQNNETEQEHDYSQRKGHIIEAEILDLEIKNESQAIQTLEKDKGITKLKNRKKVKGKQNKQQDDNDWIPIGSGKTMLHKDEYRKVNWKSYTIATRTLLLAVFDRQTLATHSLTGKKSPAFQDKPAKLRLDPKLVSDIIIEIVDRFNVKENLVRSIITTKCADECKMARMQQKRLSVPACRDSISDGEDDANRTM